MVSIEKELLEAKEQISTVRWISISWSKLNFLNLTILRGNKLGSYVAEAERKLNTSIQDFQTLKPNQQFKIYLLGDIFRL